MTSQSVVGDSRERDGRDQPETPRLVWRKLSEWVIETTCRKYRVEKFAAASGRIRYRALRQLPEWATDLGPSETDAEIAKQNCQEDLNGRRSSLV